MTSEKTFASSLELNGLSYQYPDGISALKQISFSVTPGETIALIGANGAGKSTLLLHLTGVLFASTGQIFIDRIELNKKNIPAIRRRVGLVFPDANDQLFMPSVFEDVCFGLHHQGISEEQIKTLAIEAMEQVGILALRDRAPTHLSSGEKRRAALAGILAMQPGLLLLDEPSSSLDPRSRRELIALLKAIEHTCIIATHDLELAVEVCERTLILNKGQLVADGKTADLLNDEPRMLTHGLERPYILRHPYAN